MHTQKKKNSKTLKNKDHMDDVFTAVTKISLVYCKVIVTPLENALIYTSDIWISCPRMSWLYWFHYFGDHRFSITALEKVNGYFTST